MSIDEPAICAKKLDGTIRTATGVKFDLVNPNSTMVNIVDIATGLAHNPHFNGQSPRFFSVAQHSVMVLERYEKENPEAFAGVKLLALLHDAAEAYTGDIIKPLKVLLPEFKAIEERIMKAICFKFDIPLTYLFEIKSYDIEVQNIEYEGFYNDGPIEYWPCKLAYHRFMSEFNRLIKERGYENHD